MSRAEFEASGAGNGARGATTRQIHGLLDRTVSYPIRRAGELRKSRQCIIAFDAQHRIQGARYPVPRTPNEVLSTAADPDRPVADIHTGARLSVRPLPDGGEIAI